MTDVPDFPDAIMSPVRAPKVYSILIADELALVIEGLAALCQASLMYKVVGQCQEGIAALRLIESERPRSDALDQNLLGFSTASIVRRVKEGNVPTKNIGAGDGARPQNRPTR